MLTVSNHLGGDYRLNKKLSWDDAYSAFKIAKLIASCDNSVNQEFLLKITHLSIRVRYSIRFYELCLLWQDFHRCLIII